jgi:predicted tellurium resistance membrane protein TerC
VLLAGGTFLVIQGIVEIREMLAGAVEERKPGPWNGFWLIILEIGVLDIAFSLDTVFTAVGLSNRLEVMVAAIVASVLVMMVVSAAVSTFIERHPTIKMLGLAFLILVGGALLAEGLNRDIPKGYLYFAMGFAAAVEALNLRVRRRVRPGG